MSAISRVFHFLYSGTSERSSHTRLCVDGDVCWSLTGMCDVVCVYYMCYFCSLLIKSRATAPTPGRGIVWAAASIRPAALFQWRRVPS